MAIDKFPYIREIVVALVKRNQISTWPMRKSDFRMTQPMWKSDFRMTHEEIIYICCDLTSFFQFFESVRVFFNNILQKNQKTRRITTNEIEILLG